MKRKKQKRARRLQTAIELTWDSLQSHLSWCYAKKKRLGYKESRKFHQKCVQEYAQVIKNLSKCY